MDIKGWCSAARQRERRDRQETRRYRQSRHGCSFRSLGSDARGENVTKIVQREMTGLDAQTQDHGRSGVPLHRFLRQFWRAVAAATALQSVTALRRLYAALPSPPPAPAENLRPDLRTDPSRSCTACRRAVCSGRGSQAAPGACRARRSRRLR